MGEVLVIAKAVGMGMAGIGGTVVAETAVMSVGYSLTKSKFLRACVCVAAMTAGEWAFYKSANEFSKEFDATVEAFADLKKAISEQSNIDEKVKPEITNGGE